MTEESCRSVTGLCAGACAFALVCAAAGAATRPVERMFHPVWTRDATAPPLPRAGVTPIGAVRDPFVADDAGATAVPKRPPHAIAVVVRAIALGANARALIDDGGSERIVAVGDTVMGSRIAAMGSDGLLLADGSKLTLVRP